MTCIVKLAILTQLHHIFVVGKGKLHNILIGLGIFTITFYFAVMISRSLQCIPREKIWNSNVPGTCISSIGIAVTSSSVNAVIDIILFVIPTYRVRKLQMSRNRKLAIIAVFAFALL